MAGRAGWFADLLRFVFSCVPAGGAARDSGVPGSHRTAAAAESDHRRSALRSCRPTGTVVESPRCIPRVDTTPTIIVFGRDYFGDRRPMAACQNTLNHSQDGTGDGVSEFCWNKSFVRGMFVLIAITLRKQSNEADGQKAEQSRTYAPNSKHCTHMLHSLHVTRSAKPTPKPAVGPTGIRHWHDGTMIPQRRRRRRRPTLMQMCSIPFLAVDRQFLCTRSNAPPIHSRTDTVP